LLVRATAQRYECENQSEPAESIHMPKQRGKPSELTARSIRRLPACPRVVRTRLPRASEASTTLSAGFHDVV
jgi:hypothetical protein